MNSFNHRYRALGASRVPEGGGDRYWAQDLVRDHRYLQGLAAKALLSMLKANTALLSGGLVTEGSSKAYVNVAAAVGACSFSVEVPDDSVAWSVPAAYKSDTIKVIVSCPNVTNLLLGGTLNGVATNYVKLRFKEADGGVTRAREYATGSYSFTKVDSYELVANAVAPTEYDVLLATYVGNGSSTLTITQASEVKAPNSELLDGIDSTRIIYGNHDKGCFAFSTGSFTSTVTRSGSYVFFSTVTDLPSSGTWLGQVQYFDGSNAVARLVNGTNGVQYTRVRTSGTWGSWIKDWNAANDGSGSGLDADTVDGLQGSQIIYGSDSLGALVINSGDINIAIPKSGFYRASGTCTNTPVAGRFYNITAICRGVDGETQIAHDTVSNVAWIRSKSSGVWTAWATLWSSANVGTNWPTALTAALGSGWTTALAAPAITIPSVTADPTSPVNGQMWLRSDL